MDEIDLLALIPRAPEIDLEEMLERAYKAKTGLKMTDAQWERLSPLLENVRHLRPVHNRGTKKWVG